MRNATNLYRLATLVFGLILFQLPSQLFSQEDYELGPSSQTYEGIPHGTLTKKSWKSTVFPNTVRDYYVYVPAQYQASQPAALMVFQDGHSYVQEDGNFRVATVFDNLIAQERMPVTIGLFIDPGHSLDSLPAESPWRASNRSFEYDDVTDTYGRFILEEMIPNLKKDYTISDDAEMRAIAGLSSGGICAFTTAWFFPDQFQKVMSHIGSFTDIRGGHDYPSLIRQNDKKNIKVFLQDGINDLDNHYGNWWLANLQLASALKFKGYDYMFVEGNGGHSGNHGGSIFPESLEWLWQDVAPKRVLSGVYPIADGQDEAVLVSGETVHFSGMELKTVKLPPVSGVVNLKNRDKEQIFIVKQGQFEVKTANQKKTIGAGSVLVLLPNENATIRSVSQDAVYYTMVYSSRNGADHKRGRKDGRANIINFDDLGYKEHEKGGIRNYFRRSTTMCPYYEMHMTNLNPGIKSHDPHTHNATEILVMMEGQTEMEIGNRKFQGKAGDVYFLSANVPHAIRNIGNEQCRYIAFQWE